MKVVSVIWIEQTECNLVNDKENPISISDSPLTLEIADPYPGRETEFFRDDLIVLFKITTQTIKIRRLNPGTVFWDEVTFQFLLKPGFDLGSLVTASPVSAFLSIKRNGDTEGLVASDLKVSPDKWFHLTSHIETFESQSTNDLRRIS
jgi:hypothetical protein